MKYIKLFEDNSKIKHYQEINLSQFQQEFIGSDPNSSSKMFKVSNFETFTESELSKLKSIFNRFNGYFAHTNNDNALFMHTVFDSSVPEWHRNLFGQLHNPVHDKKIPSLVYASGGKTTISEKQFYIGKLEDDWFIVMVKEREKPKEVGSGQSPWSKFNDITKYYKCDQFSSLLSLIKDKTRVFKSFSKEDSIKKGERNKKLNNIMFKLKGLSWDEFNKFYDEFTKS